MSRPTLDTEITDHSFVTTGSSEAKLSDFRGKTLVLFFYPKASTPGCTQEGLDFSAAYAQFQALGCEILGASRDSVKAQTNFKTKQGFPFELIADTEEALCNYFDIMRMKNMYGKQVRGIERSTFLIDANGVLRKEWRKVKVPNHVAEVLAAVAELGS